MFIYLVIGHSPLNPPHLFKSVAQFSQENLEARKEIFIFYICEDKTRGVQEIYTLE